MEGKVHGDLSQDKMRRHSLLLDVEVDANVSFAADLILDQGVPGAQRSDAVETARSHRLSRRLPVAGSKDWLPSLVDLGCEEVIMLM